MTIKLLTPRDLTIGGRTVTYPAGALVTLDAATETGLINSKEATATLTGGITYTPPVPSSQPQPLMVTPSAQGVVIYGPDGKIIMGTHAQGVVNVPQTGTAGAELLLASCTIPGGCLGPNGTLRVAAWLGVDVSNANLKTITIKYGGVVIGQNNNALTSARTARFECEAYGDNSEAAILALQTVGTTIAMQPASTGSGTVPASVAVDTTVDQLLEIYVNLAVATDVARVRRWAVDTRRGA